MDTRGASLGKNSRGRLFWYPEFSSSPLFAPPVPDGWACCIMPTACLFVVERAASWPILSRTNHESELRTAASNCESSRTGPIQRVECCGAIMIPRRRTLILPWPLPLPFTQPLRGLQHSVQTHAHRMMINDEITAASELRPNCRGSAGDRKPDS